MGKLYSTSVQIRDPRGNYLWIRRSSTAPSRAGAYEHPGGHAERGETAKEAARRELQEETGIKIRDDELRVVERTTGPKGDHVTFSYVIRKAVRPKLSFEHDHFVWSPEKPALSNGFLSKYMQGKDTSGMTTQEKAKGVAVGVGTKVVTRAAGKAIAKKMAARAAASAAVKVGTAGTGIGVFVTGGMMVADAAPEAWAVAKEADAHRKQAWSEVREAKGAGAKLKAAALGGGKGFLHMSTAPLRVGAASIFGSGTVKMAREAAGEAMAARKAKQNGVGAVVFKRGAQIVAQRAGKAVVQKAGKAVVQKGVLGGLQSAARQAPEFTAAVGSILKEAGKVVGIGAGVVGVSALAVQGVAGQIRGRSADKQAPSPAANKNPSSIAANVAEINKMLKNMPTDWQMQLGVNRAKLRAAGADSSQLPPVVPNAHNVLLALNLNNRGAVSSEAAAGQEPTSGKTVPDDVREAAMEGVRLSFKNNYGGYNFIGLGRAIQLAISPKISDAALNRMRMYFDRKTKQDRMSEQYTNKHGKRYWSWLNWGGDPGARWSKSTRFSELVGRAGYARLGAPAARPQRAVLVRKKNPVWGTLDEAIDSLPLSTRHSLQVANTMSRRSSHNPFDNPYHKEQPPGSQCFYIYNDDGTPVTGPTGPKFCFSEAKAKAMVAKAERAGFRVSPSAVSPGPRRAAAPPPYRAPVSGPVQFIEARFELLRPILNHHLVMSVERPHRGGEGATGKARTVQGIHPRSKYAVIHSGLRADGTVRPEFAVNMATMEISRADYDGQPREGWNYGTLDEVIARGRTLKPRENPSYGTLVEDRIRLRDMLEELPQPEKTKKAQVAQVRSSRGKAKKSRSNPAKGGELPTLKQFQQAVARVAPSSKVEIGDERNSLAFRDLNGQYLGAVTFSKGHVRFINRGNTTVLNMRGLATAIARVGNAVFRGHMNLYSAVRDYAPNVLSVDGFNEYYSAADVKVARRSKAVVANPGPGFTPTEWFADVEDSEWANWDLNRAGIMHWPGGQ